MHPLMKHREKWGPHSLEWPQPVISKHVLKFRVLYAIEKTAWCFLSLLAQCFLFICERGDRAPHACLQMTREWLLRLPAWGGKNEMLQSVNARSGESWRRDKNVSIYANWCPDPPPGCHCLLSGEKIKGPSVLNLSRIRALFCRMSLLLLSGPPRFLGGAERAAFPLVFIQDRKLILSL